MSFHEFISEWLLWITHIAVGISGIVGTRVFETIKAHKKKNEKSSIKAFKIDKLRELNIGIGNPSPIPDRELESALAKIVRSALPASAAYHERQQANYEPAPSPPSESIWLDPLPAPSRDEESRCRTIDANLVAERFEPGAIAFFTVTIRLPSSRATGKWRGAALLSLVDGPVDVILETEGFTILSERPPPVLISDDRDSAPVAFELRIDDRSSRWIHVLLVQNGRPVGEISINEFPGIGSSPSQQTASAGYRMAAEADLTLIIRAAEGRVEVSSPRDRACLDHVTMTGFQYPEKPFREILEGRLKNLYDLNSTPQGAAREMMIVGVDLAKCLPPDLIKLLRRKDVRSVMLRHEEDFDFPLELAYLDDEHDPYFVGDRIAVCRWYLGVTNPPDRILKKIARAALIKGTDDAFAADERFISGALGNRAETFESRQEVIEKIFKTKNFDLIHFTGHCRQNDEAIGGLEMADGSYLRLSDVGQLEIERRFAGANPLVFLNACASAKPYLGLTQRDSFGHRFVVNQACAVIGTLWPVAGDVANEFSRKFYEALASEPISRALLTAKAALITEADEDVSDEDEQLALRRLARQVAARSYCLFSNPDLRVDGLKQLEKAQ
ncbi:CHAT domain-containing protein [Bradyrhizobium sp. SZCCHNS3052]|uniref:CHAT domain-containing protein n=1 Tax=Bradyrhizobium sp. SZCCHNS3052 TaxID=3057321 RepID=UPI0029168ADF|nr:CHAT domain-containing protein [Bradyrhizobium sp. SZCCHNS3052]